MAAGEKDTMDARLPGLVLARPGARDPASGGGWRRRPCRRRGGVHGAYPALQLGRLAVVPHQQPGNQVRLALHIQRFVLICIAPAQSRLTAAVSANQRSGHGIMSRAWERSFITLVWDL